MREWRPDVQETVSALDKTVGVRKESIVYLWIVPARVEGDWTFELSSGGKTRRTRLVLQQRFQFVSGSAELPGQGAEPFSTGRLPGNEVRRGLPPAAPDPRPGRL